MSGYIHSWKAEHKAILESVEAATMADIRSKTGAKEMRKVRDMVLMHLKSEDEVLYPALKEMARKNISIGDLLEIFKKEMDELAPKVLDFFKTYEDNPLDKDIPSRWDGIVSLLKARIEREETVLMKNIIL